MPPEPAQPRRGHRNEAPTGTGRVSGDRRVHRNSWGPRRAGRHSRHRADVRWQTHPARQPLLWPDKPREGQSRRCRPAASFIGESGLGRPVYSRQPPTRCVDGLCTGSQIATVTTDGNGNYAIFNLAANGNYTVTASKIGKTLTPAAQSFTNLTANQTASFTASLCQYALTTSVNPMGSGTITPVSATYYCGPITITAGTPAYGYQFASFTGSVSSVSNPLTITISGPMTVIANFAQSVTQYQLTTIINPPGGGTISPSCAGGCTYSSGTLATVSAAANPGYQFTGFSGALTGGSPGYVTMNSNKTVIANFVAVTTPIQTITSVPAGLALTVDGAGCISPCSFQWPTGTNHIIVAATQAGASGTQYVFGNWSDGGAVSHTITARATAATYTANFTNQYYLTTVATPAAGGTISPTSGWYTSSTMVTVSTTTNGGYQFTGFTGGATGTTASAYFVLNAPKTVTANFATQGTTPPPNLMEIGMLSLFVRRHESLVVPGVSPAEGGLYGLPSNDAATVNSVVDSASQQLNQVEAQASSYADGYAYMNARNTILQNFKSQLQSGISSGSWQVLDSHMNTMLAPAMSAVSLDASSPPRPLANGCTQYAAMNCMIVYSEINFYNEGGTNHGLGGRIESWVEGPSAKDFSSTVSQVKESFTPPGGSTPVWVYSPLDMTVMGGGHVGRVNTVPNSNHALYKGTYRLEAFHTFTYTYTDATGTHTYTYPPFSSFFPADPPLSPATRYFDPSNGYQVYQTPIDFRLTVDGATMDSSGQTATVIGCSAPITVTAILTPPLPAGAKAPPITWTGGLPVDNLHRTVPCVLGTTSITAAIETYLQASLTVNLNAPLVKIEKVGETVISQDGNYSEDTTIRVTAVNSAGQTVTTFTGTVGIFELGSDNYIQNGGYLPTSVEITNGGSATFVAKSLAGPYNSGTGPLPAIITSSNFAVYQQESLAISQWIISGRKIDSRAGDNVYDWLQYRVKDIFAKYAADSDVNTVLNAIRSFNMSYLLNSYAVTSWERSATSPVTINPFYAIHRLDSLAGTGACVLPASPKALTDTILHEARHAYQASLINLPDNDKDGDFLPFASVGIPPADIIRDTTDSRTVCNALAPPGSQLIPRAYSGDLTFDAPDFASFAWEYDAWSFASSHVR